MSKPNDGGSAFPLASSPGKTLLADGTWDQGYQHPTPGMSLRAWLAGMAMQGFLASPQELYIDGLRTQRNCQIIARASVEQADALLAELEKDKP